MRRNYYNEELSDDKISEIIHQEISDLKSRRYSYEYRKKNEYYKNENLSDGWILVGGGKSKNSQRSIEEYNNSCWYK